MTTGDTGCPSAGGKGREGQRAGSLQPVELNQPCTPEVCLDLPRKTAVAPRQARHHVGLADCTALMLRVELGHT